MQRARRRPRKPGRILKEAAIFLAVVVVTLSARSSLADHYRIPTGSMEPTVHAGDRVLVLKAAYDLRVPFSDSVITSLSDPGRGDVVVLDSPEKDLLLLKRIVALPGERVAVRQGQVWIDGARVPVEAEAGQLVEALGTPHALLLERGGGPELPQTLVPPDHFLVLGDNRGDSHDGRAFGMISRRAIRGRAAGVYLSEGGLDWRSL